MKRGQGSLEYLLILAAILAIGVVVVIVANSMLSAPSGQVGLQESKYECAIAGIELIGYHAVYQGATTIGETGPSAITFTDSMGVQQRLQYNNGLFVDEDPLAYGDVACNIGEHTLYVNRDNLAAYLSGGSYLSLTPYRRLSPMQITVVTNGEIDGTKLTREGTKAINDAIAGKIGTFDAKTIEDDYTDESGLLEEEELGLDIEEDLKPMAAGAPVSGGPVMCGDTFTLSEGESAYFPGFSMKFWSVNSTYVPSSPYIIYLEYGGTNDTLSAGEEVLGAHRFHVSSTSHGGTTPSSATFTVTRIHQAAKDVTFELDTKCMPEATGIVDIVLTRSGTVDTPGQSPIVSYTLDETPKSTKTGLAEWTDDLGYSVKIESSGYAGTTGLSIAEFTVMDTNANSIAPECGDEFALVNGQTARILAGSIKLLNVAKSNTPGKPGNATIDFAGTTHTLDVTGTKRIGAYDVTITEGGYSGVSKHSDATFKATRVHSIVLGETFELDSKCMMKAETPAMNMSFTKVVKTGDPKAPNIVEYFVNGAIPPIHAGVGAINSTGGYDIGVMSASADGTTGLAKATFNVTLSV
ncbi:class III signal peptide-containing protein [archaeon]